MTVASAPFPGLTPAVSVTPSKVVMLEFNELSPALIERFMASGELPNFSRLYRESQVFVSDAEEAAPNLEPWIQWITVHSGLSYDEHGVFHLGDGHKLDTPCVWDLASRAGLSVWVCGCMNVRYDDGINGAVLPDPWATGSKPTPSTFDPYFRFVQRNVQEYTNDRVPLSRKDYSDFGKFMFRNGLSFRTLRAIASQLVGERLGSRGRWKRATILDKLQWDVFKSYFRKNTPHFASFFLNSTAHFQHMHWRNFEPEAFTVKPSSAEQAEYQDAILYGYREMDKIVGDALALVGDGATLILASALGQQPCLIYEDIGGKTFYRPRVFERFLEWAGVEGEYTVAPVMSEQFHVHFHTEAEAAAATERLASLTIGGEQALLAEQQGTSVFTGCKIFRQLSHEVVMDGGPNAASIPFFRLFYQVEGMKSGMHHPDGILWIRRPGVPHRVHEERVPLRAIAPTLLSYLGLSKPRYMSADALETERAVRANPVGAR